MPRMVLAWILASAGDAARLMPPALPRFPVGTCALTTAAPQRAAIPAASSGVRASPPAGTTMPRAARSGLAACSSKFIGGVRLLSVLLPVRTEHVLLRGPALGNRA